ncbi:uncharacterized protein LOC131939185 [Physella acuta]|uniref:uncharacterized protein LOC131939185 n=1 Tax=Physella acuta TaxID=109671 RepID=UPI0027DDF866|nr:uncharacterized protein LOC131939185 [Physella acuta]
MLETNSLYALGVPLQKITCVTLSDLRGVDQVMDAVLKTSAGSTWLGELLYPGKKVSLTLHSAMQGCEQGRTAYHVFQLDKGGIINITEHTNYKKFFDVDTVTKDLKVDFDKVTVQSASLKQFLDFMFKLQDNIVFTTYDRLADIDILTPVENSENSLTPLIAAAVTPAKEELQSIATELKTTREVLGTACKQAMLKLKGTSDKLKKQILEPPSSTLKMRTEAVTTALRNAQNVVKTKAPAIFLEIVDEFKSRLTRILDTYVAHVRDEVENQIGICKPISNLFTEITQGFCQFLRALGGWWCAMGWTVFFSLLATYGLVKARNEYIDEYRPKPPIAPHGGAHSQAAPSGGAASSGALSGGAPPPVAAAQDQGIKPEAAPPAPSIRSADDHGERGSNFGADADGSKLSTATFSQVPPEVARELKEVPIPRMSDFTGATSTTSTEI